MLKFPYYTLTYRLHIVVNGQAAMPNYMLFQSQTSNFNLLSNAMTTFKGSIGFTDIGLFVTF